MWTKVQAEIEDWAVTLEGAGGGSTWSESTEQGGFLPTELLLVGCLWFYMFRGLQPVKCEHFQT